MGVSRAAFTALSAARLAPLLSIVTVSGEHPDQSPFRRSAGKQPCLALLGTGNRRHCPFIRCPGAVKSGSISPEEARHYKKSGRVLRKGIDVKCAFLTGIDTAGQSQCCAKHWKSVPAHIRSAAAMASRTNAASAMTPCSRTSRRFTCRSRTNMAGRACGKSSLRAAYGWARWRRTCWSVTCSHT
jgi:hypothetical protein